MPDTIRIKRRNSGAAGAPTTLANAELAYNAPGDVLYIGKGDNGAGQATSIVAIGGAGAFASNSALAAGYQPLDADLTALAGLTGVNVIYYRSAANTWAAVTIGTGLSFAGGTLSATGGGGTGNVSNVGTPTNGQFAQWTDATHIQGINASSLGFEASANKGVANGYASLDASAKVPAAQLPAYVDDVVEYANLAAFPATGTAGVIYVALDTGKIYRWSGSVYVEISPSPGSTDAVPEGSINLYYTEARVSANATVASKAPLASPALTGTPTAPTPSFGSNDTTISTTAYVVAADNAVMSTLRGSASAGADTLGELETLIAGKADMSALAGYQPLDADLTSIAGATVTNQWLYRSGTDTWSPVSIGANLSFSGGVLSATGGGGGGIPEPASDGFYGRNMASSVGSWVSAVKKAGDTMTGALSVLPGAGTEGVLISSAAGQARLIAAGSAADVGFFCTTKGAGGAWYFYTNSYASMQVSIVHQTQASAVMLAGGDGTATAYNIWKNDGANVKTQTPAAGSNDTSIATTAFTANAIAAAAIPQCGRLTLGAASPASTLKFIPYMGDRIKINGAIYAIPSAGISAGTTGVYVNGVAGQNLVVGTFYYVYLFNNAGTLTFDFSTTTHATSTTTGNVGVEIKSGDDTRTLIGIVYPTGTAPNLFYNQTSHRLMRSWFNRQRTNTVGGINGGTASGVGAWGLFANNSGYFINFTGELIQFNMGGQALSNTATAVCYYIPAVNGVASGAQVAFAAGAANYYYPIATVVMVDNTAEGTLNYCGLAAQVSAGTSTIYCSMFTAIG